MDQKGFTLMELLTVVGVIAILVGISLPSYVRWQEREGLSQGIMFLQSGMSSARSRSQRQGLACGTIPNSAGSGSCTSLYFGVAVDPATDPGSIRLIRFCDDDFEVCNGESPSAAVQSDEVTTIWSRQLDSRVAINTGNTTLTSNRIFFNKSGGVYGNAGSAFLEAGGNQRCVAVGNAGRIREGQVNGTDCD